MTRSNRLILSIRCGIAVGLGLLLGESVARADTFTSSANVNVLREFGYTNTVNRVTGPDAAHLDGSGASDNVYSSTITVRTNTYVLPGLRTVSRMDIDYAASFDLPLTTTVYGSTDGGATFPHTLVTYTPYNGSSEMFVGSTFTPATVNAIRTVSTLQNNFNGLYYHRQTEVRLYLDASVAQPLYGDWSGAGAYNYMADLWKANKITIVNSANNAVWNPLDLGAGANLFNADMYQLDGPRTSGTVDPGQRVFIKLSLDQAYQMDYTTLGSDQNPWGGLGNSEFYTYNGASLDPSGLATNTIAALTGQGWILQKAWTNDTTRSKSFLLPTPGSYNQILFVVDAAGHNRLSNFEMFGFVPEPASLMLISLGGLALVRRRAR